MQLGQFSDNQKCVYKIVYIQWYTNKAEMEYGQTVVSVLITACIMFR